MGKNCPVRSLSCQLLAGLAATSVQADVVTDWNYVTLEAVIAARSADAGAQRYDGSCRDV